ncbi:MAG: phage major capsid protein [Eubacterium coprostanoligenes]|nr:phage major capsid protein [Eubacterium coprostanoligenes]
MTIIQDLEKKRAELLNQAKVLVESNRDEKTGLVPAHINEKYEALEDNIKQLGFEIERLKKLEDMDSSLARPTSTPITARPSTGVEAKEEKTGVASAAYKEAMTEAIRNNFRIISNVLSEGNDAEGGYLVPEEYDKRLIDVLDEENIMRRLATTITTSGEHKINVAGTKPAAAWIEEGEAISFADATFDQIFIDAHKLHVAIKVTEELLYDNAFNLESYITTEFGKALANAEEDAFLNGDGNGRPEGLFVKATIAATVDEVAADDIINLVYSLKRPYRKNASFIINDKTIAKIRTLKDNTGAYIWQPSYQAGEPDRLLGYPINTSAFAPEDKIAFGDYKYYNIGDRGSRSFAQLKELFAGNGMVGFLAKERVDGKLILPEAVQVLKIGTTGKA